MLAVETCSSPCREGRQHIGRQRGLVRDSTPPLAREVLIDLVISDRAPLDVEDPVVPADLCGASSKAGS